MTRKPVDANTMNTGRSPVASSRSGAKTVETRGGGRGLPQSRVSMGALQRETKLDRAGHPPLGLWFYLWCSRMRMPGHETSEGGDPKIQGTTYSILIRSCHGCS